MRVASTCPCLSPGWTGRQRVWQPQPAVFVPLPEPHPALPWVQRQSVGWEGAKAGGGLWILQPQIFSFPGKFRVLRGGKRSTGFLGLRPSPSLGMLGVGLQEAQEGTTCPHLLDTTALVLSAQRCALEPRGAAGHLQLRAGLAGRDDGPLFVRSLD